MIDSVQARIDRVSPWFHILDRVGGRTDEQICAFAIGAARSLAWGAAEKLAAATPEQFESQVAAHDRSVAALGRGIRSLGRMLGAGLALIRARESRPVPAIIRALQL